MYHDPQQVLGYDPSRLTPSMGSAVIRSPTVSCHDVFLWLTKDPSQLLLAAMVATVQKSNVDQRPADHAEEE